MEQKSSTKKKKEENKILIKKTNKRTDNITMNRDFIDKFLYINNHTGSLLFITYTQHIGYTSTVDLHQGVSSLRGINFCTTGRMFFYVHTQKMHRVFLQQLPTAIV